MSITKSLGFVSLVLLAVACTHRFDDSEGTTQSSQSAVNPPGNNGTVKIEEGDATDEIPENDPHVGCTFKIEFRGYDEGDLNATWTLAAQPPSGDFQDIANGSVFIGEDPAGGATDLDAVVMIDASTLALSSLYEHPQQGYHLKLTVHAEGSIGSDVKHKTFWISGCTPESSSSSSGGSSSGGSSSGGSSSGGSSSGGNTW